MEEKIASGVIFRADTIEELAQQFGADPQALAETVAKHNESCKTLEDEFGIEVPDDAIENLRTVGDVVEFVDSHKG